MKRILLLTCIAVFVMANNAMALMTIQSYTCFDNISVQLGGNAEIISQDFFVEASYGNYSGSMLEQNYAIDHGENGFAEAIATNDYVFSNYRLELDNEHVGFTSGAADQYLTISGSGTALIDFSYYAYFNLFSYQSDAVSYGVAEPYMRMEVYVDGLEDYSYWFGTGSDWGSCGTDEDCGNPLVWAQNGNIHSDIDFNESLVIKFHTEAYIEGAADYSTPLQATPVPEPASFLLLGIGLVVFLDKRKLSKDKK